MTFLADLHQHGPRKALWNLWRAVDAEVSKRLIPHKSSHVVYTGRRNEGTWTWTFIEDLGTDAREWADQTTDTFTQVRGYLHKKRNGSS